MRGVGGECVGVREYPGGARLCFPLEGGARSVDLAAVGKVDDQTGRPVVVGSDLDDDACGSVAEVEVGLARRVEVVSRCAADDFVASLEFLSGDAERRPLGRAQLLSSWCGRNTWADVASGLAALWVRTCSLPGQMTL